MKQRFILLVLLLIFPCVNMLSSEESKDSKRVIIICAHPDDCEITSGGLALLFTAAGHEVKCVSLTNGNKGHQSYTPIELAAVRLKETEEVAKRLKCAYEVVNINDGELLPTLENRLKVIRLIREWKADVVITHRPFDYHPDHRNASLLVQDAAFMVTVPQMLPEVPAIKNNPLFLYTRDRFTTPLPFRSDIVIDITPVIKEKANLLDAHVSQVYEWLPWINQSKDVIPSDKEGRLNYLEKNYVIKRGFITEKDKELLYKWYRYTDLS
ncbi:MAG: PIG-L family deacetylase, partial [Parabacteroides sp.]|nr:PIG-L family deacetylase [Parabacteroides sp.]